MDRPAPGLPAASRLPLTVAKDVLSCTMMKRFTFGYEGCQLVYWLNARDEADLLCQIDDKGMDVPDWIDPATVPA